MSSTALLDDKTPRYLAVIHDMRSQIRDGVLRPGDRLPSISELRAEYGISKGTVERAQLVLEQEGLIVREHGRGIFVSTALKHGTGGRKGFVGIYGLIENRPAESAFWPYWSPILDGAREVLQAHQSHVAFFEPEALGVEGKVDGALINGEYVRPQPQWVSESWPCVSLLEDTGKGIDSVVADVTQGVFEAVRYLVELGHTRIGYLHSFSDSGRRIAGYRKAVKELGLENRPEWVRGFVGPDFVFRDFGQEAMQGWIKDGWSDLGCTALIAHNDAVAIGAMEALAAVGVSVPRDLSVVGIDGTEMCDFLTPRLTSVKLPLRDIGKRGAELLVERLQEEASGPRKPARHVVLPTTLRMGDSVARLRVAADTET